MHSRLRDVLIFAIFAITVVALAWVFRPVSSTDVRYSQSSVSRHDRVEAGDVAPVVHDKSTVSPMAYPLYGGGNE